MDSIDKIFYTNVNENDSKYEYYLVRCDFELFFKKCGKISGRFE